MLNFAVKFLDLEWNHRCI